MFVLDSCCCCIPLRTGCLILGYLNLIGNIIYAIIGILALSAGIVLADSDKHHEDAAIGLMAIGALLLMLIIIFLAFTIALLYGLHQEKPGYVKAYLIYGLVFLIINTIIFFAMLSMGGKKTEDFIRVFVETALNAYFLLVIRSHYVRMLETNTQHNSPFAQKTTYVA